MSGEPSGAPVRFEEARRAAIKALQVKGADEVEVVVIASKTGLTRYAGSQIIQNTVKEQLRAWVRVVADERIASASTNQLDPDRVAETAEQALEAARASRPDAEFPGLPDPNDVGQPKPIYRFDEATAAATPAERARNVGTILATARSDNAAGIYETGAHAYAVFSSTGLECYDAFTRCVTSCLVDNDGATGWGEAASHACDAVDVEEAARRAVAKATASGGAADAPPGVYEVVLDAPAVATLIDYLAYSGFGAKQVLEGESFLSSRTGEMVAAPSVTISDDVWHQGSIGIGFDFEGVPKQRVSVIDSGDATGPVTDLRTARKLDAVSTGHFSGSTEFGPYASNVVMEPGEHTLEQLISDVGQGIFVTRFHYVNVLDRPSTLLTGMTRDGTFRIERGEVAGPVHNFRFTQSVLEALAAVEGATSELWRFVPDYGSFGSTVVPALRIGEFTFSSTTSH